jgi:hypothetical protein
MINQDYPLEMSELPEQINKRLTSQDETLILSGLTMLVELCRAYMNVQFSPNELQEF